MRLPDIEEDDVYSLSRLGYSGVMEGVHRDFR
jgi:hypothetical protein